MLGTGCEVVLHDFSDPEHSIVEISGDVTGRVVGGSVTEIGLALIARGDDAQDQIGYITRSGTHRVIKASTLLVRDTQDHVIGAICVNSDVTDLRAAARRLSELSGPFSNSPADVAFADDINEVLRAVVAQAERQVGKEARYMGKSDRVAIVAELRRRGAFAVQRAVPFVADYLGVSRATVYAYLEEIRAAQSAHASTERVC
jgi:predicted transcriptional regulator YheO